MNKAFEDWKAAHDAYMAAERKLADAETVYAFRNGTEPQQLRAEVNARRSEADRLLANAMQVLRVQARAASISRPHR